MNGTRNWRLGESRRRQRWQIVSRDAAKQEGDGTRERYRIAYHSSAILAEQVKLGLDLLHIRLTISLSTFVHELTEVARVLAVKGF